jgi:hypothetical protein
MTNELGVWTAGDCALVLIDYQQEMFEVIRSETSADLVEMHVRLLAKTAEAFDVPIVPRPWVSAPASTGRRFRRFSPSSTGSSRSTGIR